jgi:uncharacterized protein (TIGR02001 family)
MKAAQVDTHINVPTENPMTLKRIHNIVALAAFALTGLAAQAQTATPVPAPAPAAAPENSLGFNVGLATDYRYRGISQSRLEPALSGGIDFSHTSGFYVGAWASTIKWIKDAGTINAVDAGSTGLELDLYGGYKGEIVKDLSYDVGVLAYVYPGNSYANVPASANANTTEIYGALTYSVATLKYSHSVTNLFGYGDSKNSGYLDLSATFDLGNGWSIVPHVGRQNVKGVNSSYSYTDYSLSVSKDFGKGFSATLAAVGTDADKALYVTPAGKFTGRNGVVLSGKYSF